MALGVIMAAAMALLAGSEWGYAGGSDVFIRFGDGQVSGSGGCNRFSGPFTQDGDKLTIGPLAATRMACLDETMARNERAWFELLDAVRRSEVTHLRLSLFGADGKELAVLARRDWD